MVFEASLLKAQHYKIRINGKRSNPGKGVVPVHYRVVTVDKGAFVYHPPAVSQLSYSQIFIGHFYFIFRDHLPYQGFKKSAQSTIHSQLGWRNSWIMTFFSMVLALYAMQTLSGRIWTFVTESISCDKNLMRRTLLCPVLEIYRILFYWSLFHNVNFIRITNGY